MSETHQLTLLTDIRDLLQELVNAHKPTKVNYDTRLREAHRQYESRAHEQGYL
ncbi:hypothetical protein SEA_NEDARYA_64 [Gordonia phage Nedarya]|nr:hypothetical protein SEA_NEDARYA_64 [Gordonia phage Nedarya]